MIYCVMPCELEAELFQRIADTYSDNPDVERDPRPPRRAVNDRRRGVSAVHDERREARDRRRRRAPGTFPRTEAFA